MSVFAMYDKVACTQVDCNLVAKIGESVGTTCHYFQYCPACGAKGSLNQWTVCRVKGDEKQYINGERVE